MLRLTGFAAAVLFLSGCAKQLQVTYRSDPPGAALYQGSQNIGYAPRTLYYNVAPEQHQRGAFRAAGLRAVWASGATAEVPHFDVNLTQNGYRQQFTFVRPNVPGRHLDMQFALDLERNQIMRAQAQAQASQAYWQMYNAVQQQNRLATPQTCRSTIFGNTINTTCY